jgi:hypothetical protein
MLIKKPRITLIILLLILIFSLGLNLLVFYKARPNFPVILRTNDFGINFLANRYAIWQIPILGIALILINSFLSYLLKKNQENLSKLLLFANIGVAILLLLISLQVYLLNR